MAHLYLTLKLIHILGSAVLFGTGLGIAFFMFMAHRSGDAAAVAHTARTVVIADAVFTATAVVIQPLTGWGLMAMTGVPITAFWIRAALVLYIFVGLCWLPVVWIQLRMRDIAAEAVRRGKALPARYHRYFQIWFWLGWPAFIGVIAIFALMLWKPR
ncbi:DUF2269 family protein [Rhodoplanes sp. Z2-YC6860]|uniref:DUF2269 family protein n=1 Tax=Rhodoplanes sp. Z2-YC6860 TaxID=674703 RepID=UPI00078CEFC0|nr:DUF2269 domain-containing protein [Rhodoplanes sp. Z2-YC6860]AMN41923.1 hypothetical protein RHPLAN_34910 [Rhodoplanes sp. Z2-YC6860]